MPHCSVPSLQCPVHGSSFLIFKCRFCCNFSTYYCFGKVRLSFGGTTSAALALGRGSCADLLLVPVLFLLLCPSLKTHFCDACHSGSVWPTLVTSAGVNLKSYDAYTQ